MASEHRARGELALIGLAFITAGLSALWGWIGFVAALVLIGLSAVAVALLP